MRGTYNIDNPTFAGAIAGALKAKRLMLLTDVPGVLDKSKTLIKQLSADDARTLIRPTARFRGVKFQGGDLHRRARRGSGVVHARWQGAHAVLLELFTDRRTLIHN